MEFVGGDGCADAAAADENAAFSGAGLDGFADGFGEIGIVAGFGIVRADIGDGVAEFLNKITQVIF